MQLESKHKETTSRKASAWLATDFVTLAVTSNLVRCQRRLVRTHTLLMCAATMMTNRLCTTTTKTGATETTISATRLQTLTLTARRRHPTTASRSMTAGLSTAPKRLILTAQTLFATQIAGR